MPLLSTSSSHDSFEFSIEKSHLNPDKIGEISLTLSLEHPAVKHIVTTAINSRTLRIVSPYFFEYILQNNVGSALIISVGVSESTDVSFTAKSPAIA